MCQTSGVHGPVIKLKKLMLRLRRQGWQDRTVLLLDPGVVAPPGILKRHYTCGMLDKSNSEGTSGHLLASQLRKPSPHPEMRRDSVSWFWLDTNTVFLLDSLRHHL